MVWVKQYENESFGTFGVFHRQKKEKTCRPARACPDARGGDWGSSFPKNVEKCQNFSKQNKFRLCKMESNMLY